MRSLFFCCFALLPALACRKEPVTVYTATLVNGTSHVIEVLPVTGGLADSARRLILAPGAREEVAQGFDRGIVDRAGFFSERLSADSLRVRFDGSATISHYTELPLLPARRYYTFTHPRNLLNKEAYTYTYTDESKQRRSATYTFTFIEQDFQDTQ